MSFDWLDDLEKMENYCSIHEMCIGLAACGELNIQMNQGNNNAVFNCMVKTKNATWLWNARQRQVILKSLEQKYRPLCHHMGLQERGASCIGCAECKSCAPLLNLALGREHSMNATVHFGWYCRCMCFFDITKIRVHSSYIPLSFVVCCDHGKWSQMDGGFC